MRTLQHFLKSGGAALTMVVLAVFMATGTPAEANNIRLLSRPAVKNKDTSTHTIQIHFDIAWDNSWKTARPNNWDAAWIYVKVWDGGGWNHVYLEDSLWRAGTPGEYSVLNNSLFYKVSNRDGTRFDAPMTMEPGYSNVYLSWEAKDDEKVKACCGFFLYRKEFGTGDITVPGCYVTWMYEKQLFSDVDDFTVKVFAVEMVYVPQGSFSVGGKGTKEYNVGSFTSNGDQFGFPYRINSEGGIPIRNDDGDSTLWAIDNAIDPGTAEWPRIPNAFPKGFAPFYIMKYELSQQAWCEFMNSLNNFQQKARVDAPLDSLKVGDGILGEVTQTSWKFKSQPNPQRIPEIAFYTPAPASNFGGGTWRDDGYVSQGHPLIVPDKWVYKAGIHDNKEGLRHYVRLIQDDPFVFACDAYGAPKGTVGKFNEVDTLWFEHPDMPPYSEKMIRNIDGQDVAMWWVSPRDLLAYACFAALRPMTEFEYEKACRGGRPVVMNEYAWGTSNAKFFGQGWAQWGGPENTTGLASYNSGEAPTDGSALDPTYDGTVLCCALAGNNRNMNPDKKAWEFVSHGDTTGLVKDLALGTEYIPGYNCGYTRNVGWFNDNSAYDKYWKGEYWVKDQVAGTDWCWNQWYYCWHWWRTWDDRHKHWHWHWGERHDCCWRAAYTEDIRDKNGRSIHYWGTRYGDKDCEKFYEWKQVCKQDDDDIGDVDDRNGDPSATICNWEWVYTGEQNDNCYNRIQWWLRYNIYDYNYTNYVYLGWSLPSPLRVGCFADSTTGREAAGASYWGVMNLSDNVAEMCISVYSEVGRAFTGEHGTGQLDYLTGEPEADMREVWAIPSANDWKANQYIIERGMCFQYSNVIAPGSNLVTNSTAAIYSTMDTRWNCPGENPCAIVKGPNNVGLSKGWEKDEFWWKSGNGNSLWAQNAGMVANRCRYVNGLEYVDWNGEQRRDSAERQYLNTRSIMWQDSLRTEGPKVHNPIMRGIRCVHTQDPRYNPLSPTYIYKQD